MNINRSQMQDAPDGHHVDEDPRCTALRSALVAQLRHEDVADERVLAAMAVVPDTSLRRGIPMAPPTTTGRFPSDRGKRSASPWWWRGWPRRPN